MHAPPEFALAALVELTASLFAFVSITKRSNAMPASVPRGTVRTKQLISYFVELYYFCLTKHVVGPPTSAMVVRQSEGRLPTRPHYHVESKLDCSTSAD